MNWTTEDYEREIECQECKGKVIVTTHDKFTGRIYYKCKTCKRKSYVEVYVELD